MGFPPLPIETGMVLTEEEGWRFECRVWITSWVCGVTERRVVVEEVYGGCAVSRAVDCVGWCWFMVSGEESACGWGSWIGCSG